MRVTLNGESSLKVQATFLPGPTLQNLTSNPEIAVYSEKSLTESGGGEGCASVGNPIMTALSSEALVKMEC